MKLFGLPFWAVAIVATGINLALLAAGVWVVVWVLKATGVLS